MEIKLVHTRYNSFLFSYFHQANISHIPEIILDLIVGLKPEAVTLF